MADHQKLTKDEQRIVKRFEHALEACKRNQGEYVDKWRQYENVYRGTSEMPKELSEYVNSNLRIKWVWQQMEVLFPRLMDPDPRLVFSPVEEGDKPLGDILTKIVKHQMKSDNFVLKQRSFVQDAAVYGLAVMKTVWYQREQTMHIKQKPSLLDRLMNKDTIVKKKSVIVENRPTIQYVDPFDFFWDPAAVHDGQMKYAFQRVWLSKADLKQRERDGIYKDVDLACEQEADASARSQSESSAEVEARREGKYAVYEGWFNDGTRTVMCGHTLLAHGPNPFYHGQIPFTTWCTQPDPRSLVGTSEVENLEDLQNGIWVKDNQRIDAVNYALNFIMIADPSIPGIRNMKLHPGKKIHAVNGQRLEQWVIDPNAAPAFQESESYVAAMQQMSGIDPSIIGGDVGSLKNVTATVGSMANEEGNMRLAMKKLQFRLAMARAAKMMVQLNHQYLSEYELHRLLGEQAKDYVPLTPEEIPMFLDVMPDAMNEAMGRMQERNSLIELLNIVGTLHGQQMLDGTFFDIKPVIESTIKTYDRDPQENFKPAPPMPPMDPSMMGAPMGGPPSEAPPDMMDQVHDVSQVPTGDINQVQ